jgi:pSer/pThr/pTyr-binding forkhead associated (FHA) protein
MPTLKLNFKDKSLGDYQLQKGFSLTIGRRKNNDVVIDNLAVSSHHAKIDSVGDGFVLIDLKSKNGSFVNEELINAHWLKQGDVISIGKHSLTFCYSEDEDMPDDGSEAIEKTMVMDTSQYRSMLNKNKPAADLNKNNPQAAFNKSMHQAVLKKSKPQAAKPVVREIQKGTVGIIAYLAGGNGKVILTGKITKIGKDRTSDILVKGMLVGRTAATISRRPDGFYLSYVSGTSKPRVNENTVKKSILLNDRDIIYIGSTKLQFFERKLRKKMV